MHAKQEVFTLALQRYRIVEIPCIHRINGEDEIAAQIPIPSSKKRFNVEGALLCLLQR